MIRYICIECKKRECGVDKKGKPLLRCKCCNGRMDGETPRINIFSKAMRLNPYNNVLSNIMYNYHGS